mgnify:CR=1 FL=1
MSNNYFSPTPKISGGALFATFNSKEGNIYWRLLKQIANNQNKKGNFDGANPINVKLSQDEAADVIRAVRTNSTSSFYHKFDDNVTTGKFSYYELDGQDKEGKPTKRKGFGLTVKKGEKEVKIGFTLASAERLSLFLQNALTHIMDAEYAEDIKQAKEYAAKKKDSPQESPEPAPNQEEDKEF